MKTFSTLVFITVTLLAALPAGAKDEDLQALLYQFTIGRAEDYRILERLQEDIEKKLSVADADTFRGGEDCVRLRSGKSTTEARRGRLMYVCSTRKEVYGFMASAYYESLDVSSPVNDVTFSVSASATSCSVGGCSNPLHRGSQPCYYVTEPGDGLYCRHTPYTRQHNCLP